MTNAPETVDVAPFVPGGFPVPSRPSLGRVALFAGIALLGVSLALSVVLGILGAQFVVRDQYGPSFNFQFGDPNPAISALGLASPLHILLGSLVGVWVIVQSIVAISVNRDRRSAIVALVLAVLVPGLSLGVYLLIVLLPR
ncbi:MAG: hypothetical protein JWR04_1581 [Rhodoglobus sp.]|nr:hypothetical protein [Rhodoglobus sp.]